MYSVCSPAPVFFFGEVKYHVDESDGYVEVKVWRTGTDLTKTGTVTVRSRKAEPVSAEGKAPRSQSQLLLVMYRKPIRQGCQTHVPRGPHQHRGCLLKGQCT